MFIDFERKKDIVLPEQSADPLLSNSAHPLLDDSAHPLLGNGTDSPLDNGADLLIERLKEVGDLGISVLGIISTSLEATGPSHGQRRLSHG
jgi:hypothetical protein